MISGTHGDYSWIEWSSPSGYLYDFIHAFPEIVLQKYIAVTSCDSGPLVPTDEERQDGWFSEGEIAYNGPIGDINAIPNDQFDEWYIFSQMSKLPPIEVFINYGVFSLSDPKELFSGWDAAMVANRYQQQERFWQQLTELAPESYLAEGERLIFVTRDQTLFGAVAGWPGTPADLK
jgi:hypothetical protein